ncbi:hypothetical protein BpHYR1_035610, partial [Brachionus plicatilis]
KVIINSQLLKKEFFDFENFFSSLKNIFIFSLKNMEFFASLVAFFNLVSFSEHKPNDQLNVCMLAQKSIFCKQSLSSNLSCHSENDLSAFDLSSLKFLAILPIDSDQQDVPLYPDLLLLYVLETTFSSSLQNKHLKFFFLSTAHSRIHIFLHGERRPGYCYRSSTNARKMA